MANAFFFIIVPTCMIILYAAGTKNIEISNYLGGISNFVTFLTTLFTYIYVVLTGFMVRQAVKVQEDQSRPYIVADFEVENGMMYLVIQNIGKLPAIGVTLSFSPELKAIGDRNLSSDVFSKPFSFFPPGKKIKMLIDASHQMFNGKYSMQYDLNISYNYSNKGCAKESYYLDFSNFKKILYTQRKDIHDVAKSLEELERKFSRVVKWDGIYIKTTADIERENEETQEFYRQNQGILDELVDKVEDKNEN